MGEKGNRRQLLQSRELVEKKGQVRKKGPRAEGEGGGMMGRDQGTLNWTLKKGGGKEWSVKGEERREGGTYVKQRAGNETNLMGLGFSFLSRQMIARSQQV